MVKSEVFGRSSVSQVILKKSYIDLSLLCLLRLVDIAKSLKMYVYLNAQVFLAFNETNCCQHQR